MPMEPRGTRRTDRFRLTPPPATDGEFRGYAGLERIRSASKKGRVEKFTNLFYLIHHEENLRRAFRELDGKKAPGVDQVTKDQYARRLDPNLDALRQTVRNGGWRPRPSRQVLIPKANGGTRPLAVGCLEDKIIQSLTAKILQAIHEPHFHPNSYGFRPGQGCHQALSRLMRLISEKSKEVWVVEIDIEKFFDSMDREKLMEIVEKRIQDPHVLRLIRRQLRNSILTEAGDLFIPSKGTPQGSPLSPILANLYLDHFLDQWFEENWGEHGDMVRYADDAVFVFTNEEQARQFQQALKKRMEEEAGLKLNEEKSGITCFTAGKAQGNVTFLGFTLYWGKYLGKRLLKVKTEPTRLKRAMSSIWEWIKTQRSRMPTKRLWEQLKSKILGHYGYYAVSWNESSLSHFYQHTLTSLFFWINRRSQKRSLSWEQFRLKLARDPLPRPPKGAELKNLISGPSTEHKRKTKSRMRELRKSGSVRSRGAQVPLFT